MNTRRRFLRSAIGTGIGFSVARFAQASPRTPGELALLHTHTGERLRVAYADERDYLADGLDEINHFLRDFRTGEVYPIDPAVLDILNAARRELAPRGVFEIISGYRSPKTNDMLRASGRGVARKSFHMQGRAVDVRLAGVPTTALREFCLRLKRGGVGYYARSDFVHVDTGRVRFW